MKSPASDRTLISEGAFLSSETVRGRNHDIHFATIGHDGPWVVAHALGDQQKIYAPKLFRRISSTARILLIAWPDTRRLRQVVQSTFIAMNEARVEAAILYGSSIGGSVVQAANIHSPSRISAMILANSALPVSWAAPFAVIAAAVTGLFPESYLRKKLSGLAHGLENPEEAEAAAGLLTKKVLSNWLKWAAEYHGVNIHRMKKDDRLKPTLIIETDDDTGVPKRHREKLKRFYKGAKVHCFEEGGHFPHLKFPDEYERVVNDFLQRLM